MCSCSIICKNKTVNNVQFGTGGGALEFFSRSSIFHVFDVDPQKSNGV